MGKIVPRTIQQKLACMGGGAVMLACAAVGAFSWHGQSSMADHAIDRTLDNDVDNVREDFAAQGRMATSAALVMGLSRLYLGAHWLTDVLASYALAVSVLAATAAVVSARRWTGSRPDPCRSPLS